MCSSLRRNFSFRNRLALPCWAISTASTSPAITSPAKPPQPSGQRRWILSANLYVGSGWRLKTIDAAAALCDYPKNLCGRVAGLGARTTFRVSILASGSSGNITLLETTQTRLLIDAGLGKRETLRRLAAVEKRVDRLDGILISHEHADHIGGLPQVLAQWRTAVYLTEPTHEEARRLLPEGSAKRINRVQYIRAGQRFPIGDIEVAAVSILADPEVFDAAPRYLVLAHLSENNNNPDVARICAEEALGRRPAQTAFRGELLVASQRVPLGPLVL